MTQEHDCKNTQFKVIVETRMSAVLQRLFRCETTTPTKTKVLDVIFWVKLTIGSILGCVFGLIPLRGVAGLVVGAIMLVFGSLFVLEQGLGLDLRAYGGRLHCTKQSGGTAAAAMILAWIAVYSVVQF